MGTFVFVKELSQKTIMITKSHKIKIILIGCFVILCYILLILRLFYLQIHKHVFFSSKAQTQHVISKSLAPRRGKIFDRNMRDLAISVPVPSLYGVPEDISHPKKVATRLSSILGISKIYLFKRLSRKGKFIWLKRKITPEEQKVIRAENLPGIEFIEEIKRFYPGNTLLCHILGFVNIDNIGLAGIEYKFNDILSGVSGQLLTERDAAGREIVLLRKKDLAPKDGYHIVLTIDATIQEIVETELKKTIEEFQAVSGSIIVMDPHTGELLALANFPYFDPNNPGKYHESLRRNRAITDIFEPGSTFKPFILSIGIQEKIIELTDRFFCENGLFRIGSHILHDVHPYKLLTAQEIIQHSSNIGIAKIALKIGKKNVYLYLSKLGFGTRTTIELPGEVKGILHPLKRWSRYSIFSVPMGHEISVTAIQLVRAFCALANGGKLMKPLLIHKIIDSGNTVIFEATPEITSNLFSKDTSAAITDTLKSVTEPEGTGRKATVPGYAVAGKTGTAQKLEPDGTYSHSKYISSFIGYLPCNNPQAIIGVFINEPQKFHYGGTVAAPAFSKIASQLMRYLEIPQKLNKTTNKQ
ncbi:peptidoglycan D,D-transpeptidase FtsI family protein [Chlamydiota bacterium]